MTNAKSTGISSITGKVVYIRHATDWDRIMIGERLGRKDARLAAKEAVVAVEDNRVIGFAILEKPDTDAGQQDGCVTIFEDGKHRGIGGLVLSHLLENGTTDAIYSVSGKAGYFEQAGFSKTKGSAARLEKKTDLCRFPVKRGTAIKKYVRTANRTPKTA